MNIQSEKLRLIEWLLTIQDVKFLEALNKLREQNEVQAYEASLQPMSTEELLARAKASSQAVKEGRVSDIESIIEEVWD